MTFDQCVEEKKLPDCVFNEGSGYLLQKAHYIYLDNKLLAPVVCFAELVKTGTLAGTPSEKLERKYSELSNFHKIWNIVLTVNDHIEKKLGSEMFR